MRQRPERSLSRTQREAERQRAGIEICESFDNFAGVRNGLKQIAKDRQDWAGIPMPLDGERLIINPKFPMADTLSMIGQPPEKPDPGNIKIRNQWWSDKLRCTVFVYEEDGKVHALKVPPRNNLTMEMRTLGCSFAWGIEQEGNAVQLLGTLLRHHQFKMYLMTGMFLEKSPRSGLTYLFRKLRPTVAIDARTGRKDEQARALCALCMHPIAYYDGTWAGAMTPTDDVIAHLMLMRGDEAMFWRRSNQHRPGTPEAAI